MAQITKDSAYDAVDPKDFPAMLEPGRYGARSTAFDKIISATHDHFWDPLDKKYIDFTEAFDHTQDMMLPEEFFPIFKTRIGDTMTREQKIKFASDPHAGSSRRFCMANRARWRCRHRFAIS